MKIKKGQTVELEIVDMALRGRGIAKVDGLIIFVDRCVKGDKVMARITKKKKDYAEARTLSIEKTSSLRVEAPCAYNNYCGGCKWQFIDYEQQLIFKQKFVSDALRHNALLDNIKINETLPSENIYEYRNKMEFSCSDVRWILPEEMDQENIDRSFALGLHVPGTFNKVIDIDYCHLQPKKGNEILRDVRNFMKDSQQPVYGLKSHEGFWRFCMLRHSQARDEWMVNIITSKEDLDTVNELAGLIYEKYPNVVSVVNNITARKAGIAIGEREIKLAGEPFIRDKIGDFEFEISANSFFQTNTKGAKCLYDTVLKYAKPHTNDVILDLYSGTGTIPIYLSKFCKKVIGMEIVESAVIDAQKNCKHNNIENCQFIHGDIRFSLPGIIEKPDLLIIDPPRVGMHKDVVKQVLDMSVPKIVYVSCNPSTLARDIGMMKDFYEVVEVQPIDMFPHTFHIEAVAKLCKKN